MRSIFLRLTALLLPLALAITVASVACDTKPPVDEKKTEATTKDSGTTDKSNPIEKDIVQDKKTPDQNPVDDKITKENDVIKDGQSVCPPGCTDKPGCGSNPTATKKKLGEVCEKPTAGKENPCEKGLVCFEARIINGQFYAPVTQCVKSCKENTECEASGGETCIDGGADTGKICVALKKIGETCNPSIRQLCGSTQNQPADCLVNDVQNDKEGKCAASCRDDAACSSIAGTKCRKPIPSAVQNYCLAPSLPGPRCLGEKCDVATTATNCLKGHRCESSVCVKICKKNDDCDTANGERCGIAFGASEGTCLPKPNVSKVGEECTPLKRCVEGLTCLNNGDKTVCMKRCDTSKGDKQNPECPADQLCQKPNQNVPFGICRKQVKILQPCGMAAICTEQPSRCINVNAAIGALCLKLCDASKNAKDTNLNPDCDGGKGICNTLRAPVTEGGKNYTGVCFSARPKTQQVGQGCDFNKKDGMKSPDCVDGTRCVNLSGGPGPTCYPDCNPCDSVRKSGRWEHPKCTGSNKTCNALTAGGRPAGGICVPDGKPTRNEGEYCDIQNGCKNPENVLCVTFSRDADAKGVCSRKCDPEEGRNSNPKCPGNGRCAGLNSGGGVCFAVRKRTQDIGEGCNGDPGTPRYHTCLEKTKDGKKLTCADIGITGVTGSCQVSCDTTQGFKDNPDCKAAGLGSHLCLPGDINNPKRGACLELCSFTDRKDCSKKQCQYGVCREFLLGKREECTTPEKEKDCASRGGKCVNKTCLTTICL